MKKIGRYILGAGLIGALYFGGRDNPGEHETFCETLQGWRPEVAEGVVKYTFDEEGPEREGAPRLILNGDGRLTGNLETGKRYCVEHYRSPLEAFLLNPPRIMGITEDTSETMVDR